MVVGPYDGLDHPFPFPWMNRPLVPLAYRMVPFLPYAKVVDILLLLRLVVLPVLLRPSWGIHLHLRRPFVSDPFGSFGWPN